MKISKKIVLILFIGFVLVGTEGCRKGPSASYHKNKKKIKKGKPLPCPVKDC